MSFYPNSASIPDALRKQDFRLFRLHASHARLFYDALMTSKDLLRLWSGRRWPPEGFTLDEQRQDIQRREQEYRARQSFTYIAINASETECLGCVYIEPLDAVLSRTNASVKQVEAVNANEALVSFWVNAAMLVGDLDKRLCNVLITWFRNDWAFSRVYFGTNSRYTRQTQIFTLLGLRPFTVLKMPSISGKLVIYE